MMKLIRLMMIMSLFTLNAYSEEQSQEDFKELVRPYLVKIIGLDYTNKILGEKAKVLALPKIPEITANAKSVVSSKDHKLNDEKLKKDNEKYDFYFVDEIFKATKKESATEKEMQGWLNALRQGASREGLYRSIVLGNDYRALERFENSPTKSVIELTVKMLNTYLDLDADEKTLVNLNVFTHKKIVVEKCLELIDVFASQSNEDLSSWYGVLSADLAKNYESIWKNKIRSELSAFKHKDWAMKVPLQHLKSEIMIKLHMAYNSLE